VYVIKNPRDLRSIHNVVLWIVKFKLLKMAGLSFTIEEYYETSNERLYTVI
ncbi:hypothetical protein THOM_2693, partial [Trachipleistophora hominis]